MTEKKLLIFFVRFLKRKYIARPFFKNIHYGEKNWSAIFQYYPTKIVTYSFLWSETPEGDKFWRKIQREWELECLGILLRNRNKN